ncbi:MMS19 nucleotide excision repair protein homolog isoform X3 [Vitis vinifera]|uniref:MMS19 nucleotide excision repair protein homolog isoform X3 n=1 Tax=Vitis vinifera TaxID=29760 RepID=UPI0028834709|nr:MMS19 nucleotide excision repair protein homolog isoform X3 [Vitis vinifera]
MAQLSQLTQYIESYVDSSRSSTQQAASVDAIAYLLKNDILTLETLVTEMGMYLTTTDNIIRTRDWRALRGALIGCLALMKRKSNMGRVTDNDARAVAQAYLENVQVQSLGQHDRKLCFEILECLLDHYPESVASLGDDLVYGICGAIDGEKDPRCLMLTFHIVEILARLFPDPSGPLASFAGDLFDILGCYFPIHFTHPQGEDVDVKRDDLSRALMLAFSSTTLFEPFAIPLLLEKLSSSLPLAKVDSLKYLSNCLLKYGDDRMTKHVEAIWFSVKDAIFCSEQEPMLSLASELLDHVGFQENEIVTEAIILLQKVILENSGLSLSLIVGDKDINTIVNTVTSFRSYNDIPLQSKHKLCAIGRILYVSAKASITCCNRVFESFFFRLMDTLGLSVRNSSGDCLPNFDYVFSERLNFGALYLCIELLAACRDLVVGSEELTSKSVSAQESWCCMLHSFSSLLMKAFSSVLDASTDKDAYEADIYSGVKGLQILATFPGEFLPISKSIFENVLLTFISIIVEDFNKTLLWKLALKALVQIGSFIDRFHESEKALSYNYIVVEKIVSLMFLDDFGLPFQLRLEAISDIGTTGLNVMLKIVQGLEDAIFANLSEVYVHGNLKSAKIAVQLLECYSNKLLPGIHGAGDFEDVLSRFAVNIWNQIENSMAFSVGAQENELLNATMTAMKLAVGSCSEGSQGKIIKKAYSVLSSCPSFTLMESMPITGTVQLEGLQHTQDLECFSCRDKWVISLFASAIIAVRPQTHIPNIRVVLHLFMTNLLKGHVPAAQALGSMVNKLCPKSNGVEISSTCTLEDALDIIFNTSLWDSHNHGPLKRCSGIGVDNEMGLANLCLSASNCQLLQVCAIEGLAWIGKGLLLRGHEKVKDITMIFLRCLLSSGGIDNLPLNQGSLENNQEQDVLPSVAKSAADAFHVLMSDSEICLNKRFHANIRPLYKQRFFSSVLPILVSSMAESRLSNTRSMLYRALAHIISDTPLIAVLSEAKKIIPILLDSLSILSTYNLDKDILYNLLLVLSGILMDKNGQETVVENAHVIINCLIGLVGYPHMMVVRETAIQCLVAMSRLPHARIYPMRTQVLRSVQKALDDPKRAVRHEAVRCRQAWASIASRSLHF